jgi:hypothetical protein
MREAVDAVLNWLVQSCDVLGYSGQNWMLVVAGFFLLYIAAIAIGRRSQTPLR